MMNKDEALEPTLIKWTLGGEKDCHYDNWRGETPFGPILIIWKSWKDHPNACLVEFPGAFQANSQDQDDLKVECEVEFAKRCKEALAQPEPVMDYDKEELRNTVWDTNKQSLAQPEQEPLEYWNAVEGWVKIDEVRKHFDSVGCGTIYKTAGEDRTPLYSSPPKREWVSLTEKDRLDCLGFDAVRIPPGWREVIGAIDDKLKELNHDN